MQYILNVSYSLDKTISLSKFDSRATSSASSKMAAYPYSVRFKQICYSGEIGTHTYE